MFDAGYDKGILDFFGQEVDLWRISTWAVDLCQIDALIVIDDDSVFEFAVGADGLVDGLTQYVDVVLFEPFVEKLVGHLDDERVSVEFYGFDGFKPGVVALRAYPLADDVQTFRPNLRTMVCG